MPFKGCSLQKLYNANKPHRRAFEGFALSGESSYDLEESASRGDRAGLGDSKISLLEFKSSASEALRKTRKLHERKRPAKPSCQLKVPIRASKSRFLSVQLRTTYVRL
ncbi:hypothetical protein HPB47_018489 [Ixodes persulcatus]|uniref:Uncharacterized protein n=1 Tax=Ixodes persulcatus TaxID=34615 RepID=A0AC60QKL3_IXOPE|nr:hypothetical protein HPB47_018489 [Ixodes persulcatus]